MAVSSIKNPARSRAGNSRPHRIVFVEDARPLWLVCRSVADDFAAQPIFDGVAFILLIDGRKSANRHGWTTE